MPSYLGISCRLILSDRLIQMLRRERKGLKGARIEAAGRIARTSGRFRQPESLSLINRQLFFVPRIWNQIKKVGHQSAREADHEQCPENPQHICPPLSAVFRQKEMRDNTVRTLFLEIYGVARLRTA